MAADPPPLQEAEFVSLLTDAQTSLYAAIHALMPAHAADVLQKTNMTLWQKRSEFEPGSNFLAWARRIARYHVLNERRRLGRQLVLFDDDLFQALLVRQAARDGEIGQPRTQIDALRECLNQLDSSQRDLIRQRYSQGGSVQRLANESGKSEGAISQALYRLREALRNCIEMRLIAEERA